MGFGAMIFLAACNTLLQHMVSDDKRGRVMSFYTMAFMGMAPFGNLFVGGIASQLGAPRTVAACGIVTILAAVVFPIRLPRFDEALSPTPAQIAPAANGSVE